MPQRPSAHEYRDGWSRASAFALVISVMLIGMPGRALALDATLVVSPNTGVPTSTASAVPTSRQSSLRLIAPAATPPVEQANRGPSQLVVGSPSWTASDFQPRGKHDTLVLGPKIPSATQAGNDLMDALARMVCDPVDSAPPQSGMQLKNSDQLAASQAESLAKSLDMSVTTDRARTIVLPPNSENFDDDSPLAGSSLIDKIARAFADTTPSSLPIEILPQPPATQGETLAKLLGKPESVPLRETSFVIMPSSPSRAAKGAGDLMDQLAAMVAAGGAESQSASTSSRRAATKTAANPAGESPLAAASTPTAVASASDIGAPLIASSEESLAMAAPAPVPPEEELSVKVSEAPAPLAMVEPSESSLLDKLPDSLPTPDGIDSNRSDRVERIVVPDPVIASAERTAEVSAVSTNIGSELKVIAADPVAGETPATNKSLMAESDKAAVANDEAQSVPHEPAPIESYYRTIATADAGGPAAVPFGPIDRHGWQSAPIQGSPAGVDPRQMVVVVVVPSGNGAPGMPTSLPMPVYDQNGDAKFPYPAFGGAVAALPQYIYTNPPTSAPSAVDRTAAETYVASSAAPPVATIQPTVDRYLAAPAASSDGVDASRELPTLLAGSDSPLRADGGWTVARPQIPAPEQAALAHGDIPSPADLSDSGYGPTPADGYAPMRLALQPPAPALDGPAAEETAEGQLPAPPQSDTTVLAEPGALPDASGGGTDSIAKAEKLGEEPVNNQLQFLRSQTVLLEPGQWQWDIGLVYAHDQNDVPIALLDGMGDVAAVVDGQIRQRELFIPFAIRYGYSDRVQLFADAPVGWAHTELSWVGSDEAESDGGIGDITAGAAVLLKSEDSRDVVFTFGVTAPTGDDPFGVSDIGLPTATLGEGFWAFSGELLFIQTYDPVVVFTSLGTRQFVQREFHDNIILPGGEYFWSLGVGLAVNPRVTLSTRFIAAYVSETTIDGDRVPGTVQEPMSIRMAATISQKDYFVEPFVEFGTTNDAGSTAFGVIWTY
jgi:hypothetical protein